MRIAKSLNPAMRLIAFVLSAVLYVGLAMPATAQLVDASEVTSTPSPEGAGVANPAPAPPIAGPATGPATKSGTSPETAVPAAKPRAVRDAALYRATVTLNSQSDAERQNATGQALMQVIVKLTGNVQAPLNPVIRKELPLAASLVDESAANTEPSDSEGNTAIGGVPIYKTTLNVSFDPVKIDLLIGGSGLKYWTGARPRPMLWLAIDDGRGPRLVTAQQINVVKPLAQQGINRGLHFLLPAGTATEQAATASIWNLDAAAMQPLTARYQNDTQLIGKMYRSVSGWSIWWVLTQGGTEIVRWPVTDADPRRAIATGADGVADALYKRDAVYLPTGTAGSYVIDVVGITGQADFLRVMSYLQNQAIIQKANVVEVAPDHLRLQLDLRVGIRGFRVMVESGDTLRALDAAPESTDNTATPITNTPAVPRFELK